MTVCVCVCVCTCVYACVCVCVLRSTLVYTRKPKPLHAQAAKSAQAETLKYLQSLEAVCYRGRSHSQRYIDLEADHTAKDTSTTGRLCPWQEGGRGRRSVLAPLGGCRRCVCRVCAAAVASHACYCGAGQRRLCAVVAGRRGCQGWC